MTKFLIAGLGSIGRRHLRNLLTLGESDVVLLRTHRATLSDDELAGFPVETDLVEALRKHKPEGVVVANPTALHLDVALPAARRGCAILLEKPIAPSMRGLHQFEATVDKHHAKVLVGFQFRFHPSLLRLRGLLQDAAVGRVMSIHVHFGEYLPAWHPWEDYRKGYAARADLGGGVLLTQCHALDYVQWLIGEVASASGIVGKWSDLEVDVDDTAQIAAKFADGALGSIHLDYAQQPPSHQVMIEGTLGSIQCDLLSGVLRVYRASKPEWEDYPLPAGWERNTMFLDEMKHFVRVARAEAEPTCTLVDGVRVMRLIDAVRRSSKSGRVVSLKR